MNIFFVDRSPVTAAQMMCDKHVVKMIVESAQLLSSAHRVLDEGSDFPEQLYKLSHKNHPDAKWVRESFFNYSWLYKHFIALCDEYTFRYGKIHSTDFKLRKFLRNYPQAFSKGTYSVTEPPLCMPSDCKIYGNVVESYREYYNKYKRHIFKWTNRTPPDWIVNEEILSYV